MASEFNCDFDAPMFVDFENLDQEANPDDFFGKLGFKKKPIISNFFNGHLNFFFSYLFQTMQLKKKDLLLQFWKM